MRVYRARGKVTRKVCVCVYEEDGEINQEYFLKWQVFLIQNASEMKMSRKTQVKAHP
tara:strand:+ start:174 stop:344 length:171 start_codon:yes stop_codon:yes gene_type:complete